MENEYFLKRITYKLIHYSKKVVYLITSKGDFFLVTIKNQVNLLINFLKKYLLYLVY